MRYQRRRRTDNLMMQSGMDLFYTAFSNNLAPVSVLRNLALMAAQRAGKLKERAEVCTGAVVDLLMQGS